MHRHRVKTFYDRVWSYCVSPVRCADLPTRQAAHGNIVRVEVCRCGATRQTEINGHQMNRGAWDIPD